MKASYTVVCSAVVGLLLTLASQAGAQAAGDVGTAECREVQLEAQNAVVADGPYTSNRQVVRTAARVVRPAAASGEITTACASCILEPFVRQIAIDNQEACGPSCDFTCTCTPGPCGNCGVGGDPGDVLSCVSAAEANDPCLFADGFCEACGGSFSHGWTCSPND